MFKRAARLRVTHVNYAADLDKPRAEPKEVRALTGKQGVGFVNHIKKSGDETLRDVCIISISTGLRAGEVLGLRWEDIDLESTPPTIRNTGTLTYSKEGGHQRASKGKTANATRVVEVPTLAEKILRLRSGKYAEHLEMVFPSHAGTYIWENNFNRKLREARKGSEWDWVTVHTMRKTLATIIADAEKRGAQLSATALGHGNDRLTSRTYIAHGHEVTPTREFVDQFLKGLSV
ncbi:tyrosine-type recombinase/integrase [Corynebacterium sp. H127]|uniref:tyrosine-type recombinase/integrase n=1 Tax=Corynebacterium sp. H127 TaxID=3133418 RepID=UPI0030B74D8C